MADEKEQPSETPVPTALPSPTPAPEKSGTQAESKPVPAVGGRNALSGIHRQLAPENLAEPGVQKLLIELLDCAERDRDDLKPYVSLYHDADRERAVLVEKLHKDRSVDVMFGVGLSVGGAVIGLAPFFDSMKHGYGIYTFLVGVLLVAGAVWGRNAKK